MRLADCFVSADWRILAMTTNFIRFFLPLSTNSIALKVIASEAKQSQIPITAQRIAVMYYIWYRHSDVFRTFCFKKITFLKDLFEIFSKFG